MCYGQILKSEQEKKFYTKKKGSFEFQLSFSWRKVQLAKKYIISFSFAHDFLELFEPKSHILRTNLEICTYEKKSLNEKYLFQYNKAIVCLNIIKSFYALHKSERQHKIVLVKLECALQVDEAPRYTNLCPVFWLINISAF
jgi:hypothetical protein